jgi:hypothetical protein
MTTNKAKWIELGGRDLGHNRRVAMAFDVKGLRAF